MMVWATSSLVAMMIDIFDKLHDNEKCKVIFIEPPRKKPKRVVVGGEYRVARSKLKVRSFIQIQVLGI